MHSEEGKFKVQQRTTKNVKNSVKPTDNLVN